MALSGIDTGEYGSKAMDRLRAVIEQNQKATEEQTKTTIRLNRIMVALAVIATILTTLTAIPVVVQLWRAIHPWMPALSTVRSWLPW
jgi:hypothetical protein